MKNSRWSPIKFNIVLVLCLSALGACWGNSYKLAVWLFAVSLVLGFATIRNSISRKFTGIALYILALCDLLLLGAYLSRQPPPLGTYLIFEPCAVLTIGTALLLVLAIASYGFNAILVQGNRQEDLKKAVIAAAALTFLVSTGYVALTLRTKCLVRVVKSMTPTVSAIKAYTRQWTRPPRSLKELTPRYIKKLPNPEEILSESCYRYWTDGRYWMIEFRAYGGLGCTTILEYNSLRRYQESQRIKGWGYTEIVGNPKIGQDSEVIR